MHQYCIIYHNYVFPNKIILSQSGHCCWTSILFGELCWYQHLSLKKFGLRNVHFVVDMQFKFSAWFYVIYSCIIIEVLGYTFETDGFVYYWFCNYLIVFRFRLAVVWETLFSPFFKSTSKHQRVHLLKAFICRLLVQANICHDLINTVYLFYRI